MNTPLNKVFSGWKIFVAMFIGLVVSGWVLYSNLSSTHFVECSDGTGTHIWVDADGNGVADLDNPSEFVAEPEGKYRIQTVQDAFSQITWTSASYFWLFAALLFMVSRDFFYMVRIRLLTKNQLGWKAAMYVILLWEFASALTPGVVGGAAVAMFILNRETIPFGKATAIVIITAFMDNLFFVVMIPLVFLFIHTSTLFPPDEGSSVLLSWWFWGGFAIIFSVCLLLYLTIFWFPKLATRFLLIIFSFPFLKRWKFIAREWGKDIETASKEFKQESSGFWTKVFLSTFASWISRYLVINAILNAFLALGFIDNIKILGKQLILWLFMLVSPTPGGSGVAEFAFSELLSSFTASITLLWALAVLWRLFSYFPYLFLGAVLLPSWIRRTRR
ncbi:MAG: lysylphosphatidylglycerol synthase transmembrane domain-containing protein [Crocinitomicaceae bacterium]|nr:lysylphosphatidylglycerol synthase transmembrane domain-containing protein [Crocinitomicaceae bacterium]